MPELWEVFTRVLIAQLQFYFVKTLELLKIKVGGGGSEGFSLQNKFDWPNMCPVFFILQRIQCISMVGTDGTGGEMCANEALTPDVLASEKSHRSRAHLRHQASTQKFAK